MARKPGRSRKAAAITYDIDQVRSIARGQWRQILSAVAIVPPPLLDGGHTECPKCGGTDRFRFSDMDGNGSVICNQCAKDVGDGFGAIQWLTGCTFFEALRRVAEFLGVPPTTAPAGRSSSRDNADPAEHLEFDEAPRELAIATWAISKPPILPAAVLASGGRIARYREQFTVVALPHHSTSSANGSPVGYTLYNQSGGQLPKYPAKSATGEARQVEWKKVKVTHGSKPGFIGDLERARTARVIWKVEGPSDCLALLSLASLPSDHAVLSNANGAGERPDDWMVEFCRGKIVYVLHDADVPGQRGALGYTDARGKFRPGWVTLLAPVAAEVRNAVLPFAVAETHGQDLRDYLNGGANFADLLQLATSSAPAAIVAAGSPPSPETATPVPAADGDSGQGGSVLAPKPIEADDDPHRLARVNLANYSAANGGATLCYWRSEWYTWKKSRGCYRKIEEQELRAKLAASIKAEFDRKNIEEQLTADDDVPDTRKVTKSLVANVMQATASICYLPSSVEIGTLISTRERTSRISLKNGILDIEALLNNRPESECLLPHTPDFFTTVCLPYDFDLSVQRPKWDAFLARNQENDSERIDILQEWAGYLLTPDTKQQKFLFLEGEGSNGKSVFMAAILAMLGRENCSHVALETFGQRFALTTTLGKLANIVAECSEMDAVAEGYLKSFTSGDRMLFDRKGLEPVQATPTARLMLSANVRPRFTDKSTGLWRRMICMPWRVKITDDQKIYGMDTPEWWEASGELPGILNWAIEGLIRLRQQRRFTKSVACERALEDYRHDVNPTKTFLDHYYMAGRSDSYVRASYMYDHYKQWSLDNGHRPVSSNTFGREVMRAFPSATNKRTRDGKDRFYAYHGITFGNREDAAEDAKEGRQYQPQQEQFV